MTLSTHVLDTAAGRPARGVAVRLERLDGDAWSPAAAGETDADGRVRAWAGPVALTRGTWRLRFDTGGYFAARGTPTFFPEALVVFAVDDPAEHHHVPLLLAPYSYSTYRGS